MSTRSTNRREHNRFHSHSILILAAILAINGTVTAQAPPTPRQYLDSLGIGNSVEQLRQALKDNRAGVRSAAAGQLSMIGAPDAAESIWSASQDEQDPRVLLSFGRALQHLSDQRGQTITERICLQSATETSLRIQALQGLGSNASQNCVDSVIAASLDGGLMAIMSVLEFAMHYPELAKRSPMSRDVIVRGIESPLPPVRESAIRCASSCQIDGVLAAIDSAIQTETDPEKHKLLTDGRAAIVATGP